MAESIAAAYSQDNLVEALKALEGLLGQSFSISSRPNPNYSGGSVPGEQGWVEPENRVWNEISWKGKRFRIHTAPDGGNYITIGTDARHGAVGGDLGIPQYNGKIAIPVEVGQDATVSVTNQPQLLTIIPDRSTPLFRALIQTAIASAPMWAPVFAHPQLSRLFESLGATPHATSVVMEEAALSGALGNSVASAAPAATGAAQAAATGAGVGEEAGMFTATAADVAGGAGTASTAAGIAKTLVDMGIPQGIAKVLAGKLAADAITGNVDDWTEELGGMFDQYAPDKPGMGELANMFQYLPAGFFDPDPGAMATDLPDMLGQFGLPEGYSDFAAGTPSREDIKGDFEPYGLRTEAGTYEDGTFTGSPGFRDVVGSSQGAASSMFDAVRGFDVNQNAAEEFNRQLGIIDPELRRQESRFMDELLAKGVAGLQTNERGQGMENPMMREFANARAQMLQGLEAKSLDTALGRSGAMTSQGQTAASVSPQYYQAMNQIIDIANKTGLSIEDAARQYAAIQSQNRGQNLSYLGQRAGQGTQYLGSRQNANLGYINNLVSNAAQYQLGANKMLGDLWNRSQDRAATYDTARIGALTTPNVLSMNAQNDFYRQIADAVNKGVSDQGFWDKVLGMF